MQLRRQKDSGKINYSNVTIVTLNSDTDFKCDFLIIQKYSEIKFLALLSPKKVKTKKTKQSFF